MSIRRWCAAAWAVLVLAGGAATLCMEGEEDARPEPRHGERFTPDPQKPVPCPSPGEDAPDTGGGCSFWERD